MFVAGNMLDALASVLEWVLRLYMYVIVARAVISWVNPDPYNPIVQFLVRSTEPVLRPIRRLIPMGSIGLDISPIIVILLIMFLQRAVIDTLHQLAFRLH